LKETEADGWHGIAAASSNVGALFCDVRHLARETTSDLILGDEVAEDQ
jgi:hypothetical protein